MPRDWRIPLPPVVRIPPFAMFAIAVIVISFLFAFPFLRPLQSDVFPCKGWGNFLFEKHVPPLGTSPRIVLSLSLVSLFGLYAES